MEPIDLTDTLAAKSDQLNADDLIGREIIVQVLGVVKLAKAGPTDQPIIISISGGHQPWKPCKTMRRVLVAAWGGDGSQYIGRWLALFRDPGVRFGKDEVGGIRIRAMSHIPKRVVISLAVAQGKKAVHTIDILKPPSLMPQSLDEHVEAYRACVSMDDHAALEAARMQVWPGLSKTDKAKLKDASDAAKTRLEAALAEPSKPGPITADEAADILRREAEEVTP